MEIPGIIKVFNRDGTMRDVITFPPGGEYIEAEEKGALDLKGKRGITLGASMLVHHIKNVTKKSANHSYNFLYTVSMKSSLITFRSLETSIN